MIAGHAFVAFAIGASLAVGFGVDRDRALAFGVVAGAFGIVPDVDMAYAVVGLVRAEPTGVWSATAAFWDASKAVHRAITHSLVVAGPAAVGFGLASGGHRSLAAGAIPLVGLVGLGWLVEGTLAGAMLLLFVLAGVGVARGAARIGLGPLGAFAAALVGLGSHPFGDLFTGTPPPLFFPVGPEVFGDRITLVGDLTLNLLAVFGLELAAIWLGVGVAAWLTGWSIAEAVDPRASLGAGYGVAAFVLPPPTLDTSYTFVFSVLAVGTVGAVTLVTAIDRRQVARGAVTGLAAVTLAGIAYTVVYVLG